jgi:uncharacterized membrane protein
LQLQLNSLPVSIAGIGGLATLSGTVNLAVTGAGAQVQMQDARCDTNSLKMFADPQPFHVVVTGSSLTLNIPLSAPLTIGVSAAQDIDGGAATKTFSFPADFSAPGNPNADKPWHVGSTTLQMSQLSYSITVNGTPPLGTTLQTIQQTLASTVNSTVAQFDAPLNSIFRELGLAVGGVDVWATQLENVDGSGNPAPCGTPVTTTTTTTTPAQAAPVLVK